MRDLEARNPRPDRRPVPVASSRCVSRVGKAIPPRPTSTSLRSNAPADRYSPCHRAAGEQLHRFEYSALDSHWNAGSQFAEPFPLVALPQADAMSKTPPSADDYRKRAAAIGKRLKRSQERQEMGSRAVAPEATGAPRVGRQRGLAGRTVQGEGKTKGESATALAPRLVGLTTHADGHGSGCKVVHPGIRQVFHKKTAGDPGQSFSCASAKVVACKRSAQTPISTAMKIR